MFEIRPNTFGFDQPDSPKAANHAVLTQHTLDLFNTARWKAKLEEMKSFLFQLDRSLLDLNEIPKRRICSRHHGGIKPVSIDKICGTLGRSADFDSHFLPLSDRIRDRWVGVATARILNLPLAPVTLIQIGDCYFVVDGHHRISVARALGESAIDAEVTVWNICGPLPRKTEPASRPVLRLA
ncbi:MAG: hypothetical protein HY865_01410 [Chloroflexi bacterium]|nr:hypothetical protein [Chloroflexota bacterium]